MADGAPMGPGQKGHRNEYEIGGGGQGDALPGPVAMRYQREVQDCKSTENREPRGHAKKSKACTNSNKFGDKGQEVADSQVDHGEPAPKRSKAVKDQFCMTAMRSRG